MKYESPVELLVISYKLSRAVIQLVLSFHFTIVLDSKLKHRSIDDFTRPVESRNNDKTSTLETTTLISDRKFIGQFIVMRMYYDPQNLSQASFYLLIRNSPDLGT